MKMGILEVAYDLACAYNFLGVDGKLHRILGSTLFELSKKFNFLFSSISNRIASPIVLGTTLTVSTRCPTQFSLGVSGTIYAVDVLLEVAVLGESDLAHFNLCKYVQKLLSYGK